jgi:hypothetical protein
LASSPGSVPEILETSYWHTRTSEADDFLASKLFQFEIPVIPMFGSALEQAPFDAVDKLIFNHGEHGLASELWLQALSQVHGKDGDEKSHICGGVSSGLEETMSALTRLGSVRAFSRV